jgi:dephospho-CoA kinase
MTHASQPLIIGLVGETGSGKDTVANHIHKRYGVPLLRFADPLKKTLSALVDHPSKDDHAWLYDTLKERFGDDVLHMALRRQISHSAAPVLCVNGLRMLRDEEFVRSFPNNFILYVTADQKLRWERTLRRGEKSDDAQSFDAFAQFEETAQTEQAVPHIGARADVTIVNDGSLDDLLAKVNAAMDDVIQ